MTALPPVPADIAECQRWIKRRDKHFSKLVEGWDDHASRRAMRNPAFGQWLYLNGRDEPGAAILKTLPPTLQVPSWVRRLQTLRVVARTDAEIYLIEIISPSFLPISQVEEGAASGLSVAALKANWFVSGVVNEKNSTVPHLLISEWKWVDDWDDPQVEAAFEMYRGLWRFTLGLICRPDMVMAPHRNNIYTIEPFEDYMPQLPYRVTHHNDTSTVIFECDKCRETSQMESRGLHDVDYFIGIARKRGWDVQGKRTICPACKTTAKTKKAVPAAAVNGVAHDLTALPVAQRRQIREVIDRLYDPTGGFYRDGATDASIAAELDVEVSVVEKLRETAYGPILITAQTVQEIRRLSCTAEAWRRDFEAAELDSLETVLDESISAAASSIKTELLESGAFDELIRAAVKRRAEADYERREANIRGLDERLQAMETRLASLRLD